MTMFLLGKLPLAVHKSLVNNNCSNPQCNNVEYDKLIIPCFVSNDKLNELFRTEHTGGPFVLCTKCYNDTCQSTIYGPCSIPCSSCGANPKKGTAFSRHSPDAEKVSQHLSNQTGQSIIINQNDYFLCSMCYKTHCSIIESPKSPHGSDAMLKQAIEQWVDKYNNENTDKLTKATLETVIYVANHLLLGKGLSSCHGPAKYSSNHMRSLGTQHHQHQGHYRNRRQ